MLSELCKKALHNAAVWGGSCRTLLFTESTRELLLLHFPPSLCSPCLPSLNEPGRQSCGPQPRSEHREPSVGRERLHGDQSVTQNHTPCPACSPSLRKRGQGSVYEGKHSYTSPLLFPSLTHCLHKIILWNIFFTLIHRRGREEEREGEKEGGGGGGKSTSSLSSTNKICMSSPSYLKHRVLFCFYPPRWGLYHISVGEYHPAPWL